MLYAQIGATDAKLRSREQEHMDQEFRDLEQIRSTLKFSDLVRGAPPEVDPGSPAGWSSPECVRRRLGSRATKTLDLVVPFFL